MFKLNMKQFQRNFFDRERVINALTREEHKAFSKIGAYIRTRARRSIRKRKKSSRPGQPPHSHSGELRKGILFAYDPDAHGVVVGAYRMNSKAGNAPEILEYGGTTKVSARRDDARKKRRRVRILARPYMLPALEAELAAGTIPEAWRDIIRRGD